MELTIDKKNNQLKYPTDWGMLNLGKSSILKARIGWQGLTTAEYLDIGEYFLITGTDFKNGFIDWDNCVYVEKERYDQDKYIQVQKEDVLVTKDGTIGKVAIVNDVPKPTTLNSGVFVIRPIKNSYNPKYFYYVLMSEHFRDFLGKLTAGSTISHLYQKDFIHYNFPLPPTLKEQKAIATALSDIDDLIASLESLIAKKQAIKQGAMQQLLTPPQKGGKRLPGFSGEWVEKKLGEVFQMYSGGTPSSSNTEYYGGDIPWISSGELNKVRINDTVQTITQKGLDNSSAKLVEKGTLLFAMYGATAGVCAITNIEGTINQAVLAIEIPSSYSSEFLFQYLMLNKDNIIEKYTQGGQPNLSGNIIKSLVVSFPDLKEEQKAISEILSDMDTEITQLESKKAKYQQLKQGMMQELLTGKTRLV